MLEAIRKADGRSGRIFMYSPCVQVSRRQQPKRMSLSCWKQTFERPPASITSQ